jgi:hypothetical protein
MDTRTVGLSRFSAAACATVITAVSAWAFVSSTAALERDPFQFASFMARNAEARGAQTARRDADHPPQEVLVRDYELSGLLAPLPPCLAGCS